MGMKPLFFESCHFWVFLEKYTKYPVFINFFGTLRNLHDIKEREKGNDDDGTEVQSARPFFISSFSYCLDISKSHFYVKETGGVSRKQADSWVIQAFR